MKAPELMDGALAVIGDVHGELEALDALLAHIDRLPTAYGLVFVGDLVDRGPDSPGVLRRVRALVDSGRAQVVLGNHELNLLCMNLGPKSDNAWLRGEKRKLSDGVDSLERLVKSDSERSELLGMLADVPFALERDDLRVVHAAWHAPAIQTLLEEARALGKSPTPGGGLIERHNASLARIRQELDRSGLLQRAREEGRVIQAAHPIGPLGPMVKPGGQVTAPAISTVVQERELALQNTDPLRLVTSGPEAPAQATFAAGGKWRHTRRAPWWNSYTEDTAVAYGHFWRGLDRDQDPTLFAPPDPFHGESKYGPLGPKGLAYCLDYSVGKRFVERAAGNTLGPYKGRLVALLWPQAELLFDNGEHIR